MRNLLAVIGSVLLLVVGASAQFQFFEQMFQGGGQQQHRGQHDGPSDSQWYQDRYGDAHCSNYLCPDTLACVSVPHHCPCPHPAVEEKFELQEGKSICISKGGYQLGEAAKKVELARKGLI